MPDPMTPHLLDDLLLFIKVVDKNSFTGAAENLGLSKSVVSKRISRLEHNLGAKLMYRSTRRLALTETGQNLYDRSLQIGQELEETIMQVTYSHSGPRGKIRIASPSSFGNQHLAAAIADFMNEYPEVNIELLLGNHYQDLYDNGLDLGIRIGSLPDSSMMARKLTMRAMRVCASPEYLEKHGRPEKPSDLVSHNCLIHANSPIGDEWHFEGANGKERIKIQGNLRATTSQSLEQAAVAGLGLVMLPGYLMTNDVKAGRLEFVLSDYCPKNIDVYAVYPQNRHLAPKVRMFIDFLAERFGSDQYWGPANVKA